MFECKECPNRQPGCHAHCESYLEEKHRLAGIREQEQFNNSFKAYEIEKHLHIKKRGNYK